MTLPGGGGDFAKGASGADNVYDTSPAGLGLSPSYLAASSASATASGGGGSSAWVSGDYKISAQNADHADPAGGEWLICDATAIDVQFTTLIALVGANRPDARGRSLVMKGTHADVDAIGDNEGVATVANRRPKHNSTSSLTLPNHGHSEAFFGAPGDGTGNFPAMPIGGATVNSTNSTNFGGAVVGNPTSNPAINGTIGPSGTNPVDTPSYIVPGNLFVHT